MRHALTDDYSIVFYCMIVVEEDLDMCRGASIGYDVIMDEKILCVFASRVVETTLILHKFGYKYEAIPKCN